MEAASEFYSVDTVILASVFNQALSSLENILFISLYFYKEPRIITKNPVWRREIRNPDYYKDEYPVIEGRNLF